MLVHSVSCNLPRNITYLKSLSQKKTWICSKEFLSNISPSLTLSCSFFWSTVDGEQRQSSKITFCFCVRWKLIKGNFTQMESASRKKSSHTVPLEISYENWQSQTPGKKSSTGDTPVRVPNRKKYASHLLEEPRRTPATQPRKKGHCLELSLSSNGLSFKTILPNLLLFSIK